MNFIVILAGEHPEYFETLIKAEEYASDLQAEFRQEAARDGEWRDDTRIEIFQRVKAYDIIPYSDERDDCDYTELKIKGD